MIMNRCLSRRHFNLSLLAASVAHGLSPAFAASSQVLPRKVIFDGDPGIDDAMALLFLHYLPQVDLQAITTVFGNASIENTTRNALFLAERFGINAPVARGAARPLVGEAGVPPDFVHGKNGLGDIPLPEVISRAIDPRPAHRLIIEMLHASPGEVTLIAVGRMTNLALALREAPEIAKLAKQVVVMGGAFGFNGALGNVTPAAEANIEGDPTAADEVFGAAWPITLVGLDVTQQIEMSQDYLRALSRDGGEVGRFIWDISRFYEKFYRSTGERSIFVHDASAVAYFADPTLFKTRSGPVRVVTEGLAFGETIQKPDGKSFDRSEWNNRPSQKICVAVDAERLRRLFRCTILAAKLS